MDRREQWRTGLCFALFGVVVLVLLARLVDLQAFRSEPNREGVRRSRNLHDPLPAPRGTILDRHGRRLAYDRPILAVHGAYRYRVPKGTARIPPGDLEFLASSLASQLLAGAGDFGTRQELRDRLLHRLNRTEHDALPTKSKKHDYLQARFLVAARLDSHEAVRRLRTLEALYRESRGDAKYRGALELTFTRSFERTYPGREFTEGLVGNHYIAQEIEKKVGDRVLVAREGFHGLESCSVLWPRAQGGGPREASFHTLAFRDTKRRRYWTGIEEPPASAPELRTTIDLELQELAQKELVAAADAVAAKYGSPYEWGAMVLVDVPTGDVLALASHYPGRTGAPPFAPFANTFEPGSVIKPLVIAFAHERGLVPWEEAIDCTPTRARNGRPVAGHPRRIIYDDHACGVYRPHQILVESSNIGAVAIGTRLGRAGMMDCLRAYGFCERTGLGYPGELAGFRGKSGIAGIGRMSEAQFGRFTGPSLSFGYELNVTPVQLARAYLRLVSGRHRELRLVASVHDGRREVVAPPAARGEERFLSRQTVDRIRAALSDVVSDTERATGAPLHRWLVEQGIRHSLVAGKTGTSDSGVQGVRKKTATFVGFAPAETPRYLVVCVLRKEQAARFYGGSYAAPPAGRLLLGALTAGEGRRQPGAEQVSARRGVEGRSSAR